MTEKLEGQIIASQVGRISNTDKHYGFITIKTPKDSHVKVKIDSYTTYDTLEMGHDVEISTDELGTGSLIVAKEVRKK